MPCHKRFRAGQFAAISFLASLSSKAGHLSPVSQTTVISVAVSAWCFQKGGWRGRERKLWGWWLGASKDTQALFPSQPY